MCQQRATSERLLPERQVGVGIGYFMENLIRFGHHRVTITVPSDQAFIRLVIDISMYLANQYS